MAVVYCSYQTRRLQLYVDEKPACAMCCVAGIGLAGCRSCRCRGCGCGLRLCSVIELFMHGAGWLGWIGFCKITGVWLGDGRGSPFGYGQGRLSAALRFAQDDVDFLDDWRVQDAGWWLTGNFLLLKFNERLGAGKRKFVAVVLS